jgi:hypothetical protein
VGYLCCMPWNQLVSNLDALVGIGMGRTVFSFDYS